MTNPYPCWDGTFAWFESRLGIDDGSEVPADVYARLTGYLRESPGDADIGPAKHYASLNAAMAALAGATA